MLSNDELYWWDTGLLNRRRFQYLLEEYGDLREARRNFNRPLLEKLGMREEPIDKALQRSYTFNAATLTQEMEKRGIGLLSFTDEHYPLLLKEIADPPIFLSYRGDVSVLSQPLLGIVGTRAMSTYGKRAAEYFSQQCAHNGLVTVSGLARGVDSVVAEESMRAGGKTVAVLGGGLGCIYPKANEKLAEKIVESGGLVLSEFPLMQQPERYMFPARNRIIAGLNLGTLVVEAPLQSGSIITAELALEYGREVFAVPGQMFDEAYAGCHKLLSRGHAKLVTDIADILPDIGVVASENGESMQNFCPATPEEELLFNLLTSMPTTVDNLAEKSLLSAPIIGSTLTMMELSGGARHLGAGQWVRS